MNWVHSTGLAGTHWRCETQLGHDTSVTRSETPSGGGLRGGIPPQALPLARRKFEDQPRRMGRGALDHVAQIDEGIDV
jgi:hypothetical protein